MGLMYRVIRKYRDEMNICPIEPRKTLINHENFLNVYFDRCYIAVDKVILVKLTRVPKIAIN